MYWHNPRTRVAKTVAGPYAGKETEYVLAGATDSWALVAEYGRQRGEGMGIEQALIFVGRRFRMWHLRCLPVG